MAVKKSFELLVFAEESVEDGLRPDEIDETAIRARLAAADVPDPDLVIRTSGEQRISNFMLWQSVGSPVYFTECAWPDFDAAELDRAIALAR